MRHSCCCGGLIVKLKTLAIILLLFAAGVNTYAQTEKYIQSLSGYIKKGDSCVVTDDKFTDSEKWAAIEKHLSVTNLLTFELRYDTMAHYLDRSFSCTLQVDIEYEKADRSKTNLKNVFLELNYDTTAGSRHQGIVYYKFNGGHHVKLTVNKIASKQWGKQLPPVFRIKNEIIVERLYTLNTVQPQKLVLAQDRIVSPGPAGNASRRIGAVAADARTATPGQQVTVSWAATDPAFPQYDFEWTFYDDSSMIGASIAKADFGFTLSEMEGVFVNNSSRVTVGLNSYQLDLNYNSGWLFHRVRGVRYEEATGVRTEGAWSYAGSYNYKGNLYGLIRCTGHEDGLNWQYSISFAEQGKRKELVSYFDGSLRKRQSVTLSNDNTGSRAIVQESVFDALGRPAVNILPAPVNESTIHYFPLFNRSAVSNTSYQYADIETAGNCLQAPSAMSTMSGASQYYSAANPALDGNANQRYFAKYIPDAKGYPFSVTSFTPDNTGRIRMQGGLGPVHQPGQVNTAADHTTRYFYGKPQQDELDRLFGNEAGNAAHYLKNMVVDANGQTSVSYINANGKTVATALAGKSPDNLQPLPSYKLKSIPFITSLAGRDNFVRDAEHLSLTYNGTFLASAAGNFTLQYEFTPLSLQVLYGTDNNKICADCYYDLQISVTDNCGNTVQSLKQEAVFTEKITCDPAPTRQEAKLPLTIREPGEYNIAYTLTLSQNAIGYYINQYLVQNLSLQKEIDFQRTHLRRIDLSGCFNNCETCLADLGTEQNFVKRMTAMLQSQHSIIPDEKDTAWLKAMYVQLMAECQLLQQGCGKTTLPCEEQTLQLKEDLTPGGQYMLYDPAVNLFIERDINVFLNNIHSLTTPITINGVTRPFNQFGEADIITHWEDAWADILLPYHPENRNNCFITDCGKNAASDLYDQQFLQTEEAALAMQGHYWFEDDYTAVVNNDPYFSNGAEGASKKLNFIGSLENYRGTGQDIMSFVRWTVYCRQQLANGDYPVQISACPRTTACNRAADEWALFKILYYTAKQEVKDKNTQCNTNDLFVDPTAAFIPVTGQLPVVPATCAAAAFFEISHSNSSLSIRYTGAEKITRDITVQYFGVNSNNQPVNNARGTIIFPAGTETNEVQTVPGADNLSYIVDFVRCDPAHPYYSKTRRNFNGLSLYSINGQLQNTPRDQLNAAAAAAMIRDCEESCAQQADGWMQKLEGCNLEINSNEYRQIREGLMAVCKSSCQLNVADHPFGASSTTLATADGDKNFSDVLLRVLGKARFSAVCNDLLLDYPPPIDASPLYTNEVVRTLSVCAYDKLMAWKTAYLSATGYTSLSAYIKKIIDPDFSLTDADISNLLTAFGNNCVMPKPVPLPASLSCHATAPQTCLSCAVLQDEVLNFNAGYHYVTADDPVYFELLAKYINRKYSFSLSSVDIYHALQECAVNGAVTATDTVSCEEFRAAYGHFEDLKPGYFTRPDGNPAPDSAYKVHLTLWLNTELHRQLSFDYYRQLAAGCGIVFNYPGTGALPACDTSTTSHTCIPQFITCCEPFAELLRFNSVFPDSADARLLALYFSLLRTQWCTAVNLPAVDYQVSYDSLLHYFNAFKLANDFNITIRPDSFISYTMGNTGACNGVALNFKTNTEAAGNLPLYAICNKPLQPSLLTGDNECINQQLGLAMNNAHGDYLEYMEKVRRDYRDAYYVKCLSITPRVTMEAVYDQPLEYHYTLYYYDQSGNLVKTIPPAGVQPVDAEINGAGRMQRVKNFRLADKDYCYEYGDAPAMNGNASITVAGSALAQQGSLPFTIEAFVNFSNLNGVQAIFSRQSLSSNDNRTDGYKIYLQNGRLRVDMAAHGEELWTQTLSKIVAYPWPPPYTAQPPVMVRTRTTVEVPRSLYRSLTAEITSDLSGIISKDQWVYLAVQHTADWNEPVRIYINGNAVSSRLVTNSYEYTPAAAPPISPADLAAGTIEYSFAYTGTTLPLSVSNTTAANLVIGAASGGLTGSIKQVRLYNFALTETEIRANAFNTCLVPQHEAQLVIWLPLNKEESPGLSIDRVNQLTTTNSNTVFSNVYQPVYPLHTFPTHYYYNSLQAVTKQVSPDGGTSRYFYDLPGRLIVSQNAEQQRSTRGELDNRYSYTQYDALGRVTEVGEKTGATAITAAIAKTDPAVTGTAMNTWMASGRNIQVTQTIYDQANKAIVNNSAITDQQGIFNTSRKRVVATVYRHSMTSSADYNNATHYQYDISGNVKRLWQEYKKSVTDEPVNMLKDLQYDYDLVSGKVNHVIYQQGKGDQFIYRYKYDPDNRLLRAYSGRDMNTLQQDAGYGYYPHGPLARLELGDALTGRMVQGSDYAYTLQGWLKGVNGVQLATPAGNSNEMGDDGSPLNAQGMHAQVGRDALAYVLGYYKDDYTPVGGAAAAAFGIQYQHPALTAADVTGRELFNGNISHTVYSMAGIDNGNTRGYSYQYDQLNRLRQMRSHQLAGIAPGEGWNNGSVTEAHKELLEYDANGNISRLLRNGTATGGRSLAMDDMAYRYYYFTQNNTRKTYTPGQPLPADAWALSNQLATVNDAVPATNYPVTAYPEEKDIDNQPEANYTYDGIGNLVSDNAEGLTAIAWTVYGKIGSIAKSDGTRIVYEYDAAGNRVQQQVIDGNSKTITYYVRDAQGNTMAVYSWRGRANEKPVPLSPGNGLNGQTWEEQQLYGSSRLGMWKPGITVPATLNPVTDAVQVGSKFFELTSHLGNVLAVISDKKLAIPSAGNPAVTDHYEAELISAHDYSPFGMPMVGRNFSIATAAYRYGFNGKENDNAVKGEGNQQDYGMRVYDGRLGRFLSVDPITNEYPGLAPYQFASNSPVAGIDIDGLEFFWAYKLIQEWQNPKIKNSKDRGFVYGLLRSIDATGWADRFVEGVTHPPPPPATIKEALTGAAENGLGGPVWGFAKGLYLEGKSAINGNKQAAGELTGDALSFVVGLKTPGAGKAPVGSAAPLKPGAIQTAVADIEITNSSAGLQPTPIQQWQANAGVNEIQKLQLQFEELAESKLLPKFRLEDPNLKAGYTGSFKTGVVGNRNKATFGQPINLASFDIDFWIESDILFKRYRKNLIANTEFRELLSQTPGFEGLRRNRKGFSIKFKPSRKK